MEHCPFHWPAKAEAEMDIYNLIVAPVWGIFLITPVIIWYLAEPRGWRL
jgi:hypothetical protein